MCAALPILHGNSTHQEACSWPCGHRSTSHWLASSSFAVLLHARPACILCLQLCLHLSLLAAPASLSQCITISAPAFSWVAAARSLAGKPYLHAWEARCPPQEMHVPAEWPAAVLREARLACQYEARLACQYEARLACQYEAGGAVLTEPESLQGHLARTLYPPPPPRSLSSGIRFIRMKSTPRRPYAFSGGLRMQYS
jgi:hypothetical protein